MIGPYDPMDISTLLALAIPLWMLWYAHRVSATVRAEATRPPPAQAPSHVRKVPR